MTGDAADELFGGYSFTHRLDEAAWEHNRQRMASLMHFGSVPLGEKASRQGWRVCRPGGAAGARLLLLLLLLLLLGTAAASLLLVDARSCQ